MTAMIDLFLSTSSCTRLAHPPARSSATSGDSCSIRAGVGRTPWPWWAHCIDEQKAPKKQNYLWWNGKKPQSTVDSSKTTVWEREEDRAPLSIFPLYTPPRFKAFGCTVHVKENHRHPSPDPRLQLSL